MAPIEEFPAPEDIVCISSDSYSTIIEFSIDDFELIPVHTEQGNMHLVKFKNGASILKQGAPDIHKISRSIIIPDHADMKIEILSSIFFVYRENK